MEPPRGHEGPELPRPTLWPIGFAIGIACILVGIVVSWPAVAVGAGIAIVFGFLWARDVMAAHRAAPPPAPAEAPAVPPAMPEPRPGERFPRSKFLEGATLGLGAVIGGAVTVPAIGFAIAPPFIGQRKEEIDVGRISDFPDGQFVIVTFLLDPEEGEVSRRTAYVRNNGFVDGRPSFTIVSNRCAHLGCPVQPNGPVDEEKRKVVETKGGQEVTLIPTQPAGFGCPCHGGAYDIEGNRTAGPPVRALDRYEFAIRNGRLFLGKTYSVASVEGAGARARIRKYQLTNPGDHVDGWERWLYPVQPPS